jgi:hypothetical protein
VDRKTSKPKRLANFRDVIATVDSRPALPPQRRYQPLVRPSFIRLARVAAT